MARLRCLEPDAPAFYPLSALNTLGRHPRNSIHVVDGIVSKEHCVIERSSGDSYVLRDLASLNGTYVNGRRVDQHVLQDGDEILLGTTHYIFESGLSTFPVAGGTNSRITILPGDTEARIHTKLLVTEVRDFMPAQLVDDVDVLRRDYERLRLSYVLSQAIGTELDIDRLLSKVLDQAIEFFSADRGVVLLLDDSNELVPRCARSRAVNAQEQEELMISRTILNEVVRDRAGVVSSDALVDARFQAAASIIMQGIRSSMAVPLIASTDLVGVLMLTSKEANDAFSEKDLRMLQTIAMQAATAIQNTLYAKKLKEQALIRERLNRLFSPAIAQQVFDGRIAIAKGGELRAATVLFADIRGFTRHASSAAPQDVMAMLNEYFELMAEVIFEHDGTLDKFIGDAIMAVFGAPIAHADDPIRAVKVAAKMLHQLGEFNRVRVADGQAPIEIGVGINTGEVVAGYLGSTRTLEYTVVGDPVNVAARLCSLAKPGEILVTEETRQHLAGAFRTVELSPMHVKGKAKPLSVSRIIL